MASGVQLTRPVNMNGAHNASVFFTYGKTMRKLKGGNINATTFINYNQRCKPAVQTKKLLPTAGYLRNRWALTTTINKLILVLTAVLLTTASSYSLQPNLNSQYYTQTYSPEFNYTFFKSLIASTDLDYTINSGLSAGYNQHVAYWNASLALQIFKKKDGEIKLGVYDILNQNKSFTRSTGDNYIQDTRTNVLKRYLMLSFTYNFKKGSQQNNGMPMPKTVSAGNAEYADSELKP